MAFNNLILTYFYVLSLRYLYSFYFCIQMFLIVGPLIYDFWLSFSYLQTFLLHSLKSLYFTSACKFVSKLFYIFYYYCQKQTDRWFSPDPQVSSTNKTDGHDVTEILLKVILNTIKQTKQIKYGSWPIV